MQVRRTSGFEFGLISHMSFRNHIVPTEVMRASNRQKYDGGISMRILAMAEGGKFPEEWCAEIGITMRTLYVWANEYPEVAEAVEAAWHLLHAYWARLLRENMMNPALRQTTILHVMAKRFPATWGQAPNNTLEHFLARGEPARSIDLKDNQCPSCKQRAGMSREEISERIAVLQARRDICR